MVLKNYNPRHTQYVNLPIASSLKHHFLTWDTHSRKALGNETQNSVKNTELHELGNYTGIHF